MDIPKLSGECKIRKLNVSWRKGVSYQQLRYMRIICLNRIITEYLTNGATYTWWFISLPSTDIWKWIPGYIDEKCLQEDLSSLFVSFLPFEFPSYPIIVWERVFYNIMLYQYKKMWE